MADTQPIPMNMRPEAVVPQAPTSAGAMLRELRISAGVDAAVLASVMKVSLEKIEALEREQFDALPDMTFARGLAASICRAFGVDPAPVLDRMPAAASALAASRRRLDEPFRSSGEQSGLGRRFSRPVLAVILLFLLGAAVLWIWPTLPIRLGEETVVLPAERDGSADQPVLQITPDVLPPESDETPLAHEDEMALAAVPGVDATTESSEENGLAEASAAPMDAGAEQLVDGADADEDVAAAAEEADAVGAAGVAEEDSPASEMADNPVVFTATGDSWVSVLDASGQSLLNRTLQSGETVGISGTMPMSVTVGRKSEVQISVRGKPFEIQSIGRSSVARFELK